jgi:hypothetical protein
VIAKEIASGTYVHLIDFSAMTFPLRMTPYAYLWLGRISKNPQIDIHRIRPKSLKRGPRFQVSSLVDSEMYSYFRDSAPKGFLSRIFQVKQDLIAKQVGGFFSDFPNPNSQMKIYISNGRGVVANSILKSYLEMGSIGEIVFLETGTPHNPAGDRYFSGQYPIHDRVSRQSEFNRMELDSQTVKKLSDAWLKPRVESNSSVNAFASRWKDSAEVKRFTNVFFTSSSDEYWALGTKWQEDSWLDQYEAFDAILSELETLGESSFAIRVHPNLINKSVGHFVRESDRLKWITARHPSLVIFMPHDSVNSYKLLEHSTRVFVSMSTIGLEASASGKSVWATSANSYDLVSDIRRIFSREDLSPSHLETWTVDMAKARKFLSCQILEGRPYEFEHIRLRPPLIMTLPILSFLFRTTFFVTMRISKFMILYALRRFSFL